MAPGEHLRTADRGQKHCLRDEEPPRQWRVPRLCLGEACVFEHCLRVIAPWGSIAACFHDGNSTSKFP